LCEYPGGYQRAAAIGGGEPERRNGGQLPPGDRGEQHDAFGAIDRCRGQQRWARISLVARGSGETDPQHDLANRDHADEPVGRPSARARPHSKREQARLNYEQQARQDSRWARVARASQQRGLVTVGQPARLGDSRQTQRSACGASHERRPPRVHSTEASHESTRVSCFLQWRIHLSNVLDEGSHRVRT
jgi:hypothetical protein